MSLWAKFQCCCPSNKADPISVVQLWRKDPQLFQLGFLTGRALLKFLRVIWDQKVSFPLGCLLGQGEQERLPEKKKIKMIQWPRASYCKVIIRHGLSNTLNLYRIIRNELTPFWKAMEWICMMLFRANLRISSLCRFQNMPSGTEVSEFPERSKLFNDPERLWSSSRWRSEMRLSREVAREK